MFGLSKRMLIVIGLLVLVVAIFVIQNNKNSSAQPAAGRGECEVQVSADVLNVRSAPEDSAPVVDTLTGGTISAAETTVRNGYRELGDNRWVSDQFVKPVAGAC